MGFLSKWYVTAAGYAAAGALLWLFIGAKADLAAEVEACNTRAETAAREAVEATKEAQIAAYERQIAEISLLHRKEADARLIAEQAAREAQNAPERVRTIVKELKVENACLDSIVPDPILDSLREGAGGLEAGDRGGCPDGASWCADGLDAPSGAPSDT